MAVTKRKVTGDSLEQYVSHANEVIRFKFILQQKDIDDDANAVAPEFTHQIFGESENIFGYIGLQVTFLYSACRLTTYCKIDYREKVKPQKTGGVEADDVYKIISEKLELEPMTDLAKFTQSLEKEHTFKPCGEQLCTFSVQNCDAESETYGIYRADLKTPGHLEYHRKMQTLLLWFIDAASYIDDEDERWDYFILHGIVEKDGKHYHPFIGYATVYRYYAYPANVRPRVSQVLILPQYQKRGLGTKLIETICASYWKDSAVLDITAEDPSDEFISIRDYIDCKNCMRLGIFAPENLWNGFSSAMAEEARLKFKINRRQARRVYEILRLKCTNLSNPKEYREYRLNVKQRLNIPFQREKLNCEKLRNLSPKEVDAAVNTIPHEQRIEQLEQSYADLESRYKHIIERLTFEE